jgi:hypothetical protein
MCKEWEKFLSGKKPKTVYGKVIVKLRIEGSLDSDYAMDEMGIRRLSHHIYKARNNGYTITSHKLKKTQIINGEERVFYPCRYVFEDYEKKVIPSTENMPKDHVKLYNDLIESRKVTKFEASHFYDYKTRKKTKRISLGLNNMLGMNKHLRTKIKDWYTEEVQKQMTDEMFFNNIRATFFLFRHNASKMDVSNFCSIHDKFFMDALVKKGCMKDDNWKYYNKVRYFDGGIDRENPRVEIFIEELG